MSNTQAYWECQVPREYSERPLPDRLPQKFVQINLRNTSKHLIDTFRDYDILMCICI